MPTTFANTIDGNEILAKRSQCDYAGNDLQTTYATKNELPTATSDLTNDSGFITSSDIPVKDVQVGGASVVNAQGIAEISIPPTGVFDVEVDGSSVVNAQGVAEITLPTFTQVNADWDATSGVSEIFNKPDLSIYAESSDLATVAISGSYNDLLEKPSIPAAQVNADWNSSSGVSEILNKPTLATVATSGSYNDLSNKPTIPTATSDLTNDSGFITLSDVPAQVNADWNSSSGASEILNKPSIPSGAQLVPAATSADADKVLTVDSQGTPAWTSAQAPISAGTGIDITNNVVSVDTSVVATQTDLAGKEDAFDVGTGLEMDTSGSTPTLQVEAPVDIVAGPGIVIDNPDGNTLRVSTDENYETVLFDGTAATSVTCSEAITNFERLKVYVAPAAVTQDTMIQIVEMIPGKFGSYMMLAGYLSNLFHIYGGCIANSGTTTLKVENGFHMWVPITSGGSVGNEVSNSKIAKVIGIHRIQGGN